MQPTVAGLLGVLVALAVVALVLGVRRGLAAQRGPATAAGRELEADLFRIVEGQPGAAVLVDPDDQVLCTNQLAEAVGMSRGTRMGSRELLAHVRQVREFDEPLERMVVGDLVGSVVPLSGGRVLVVAEDHSSSRRADEARRDFLANVSHELKTPVGAIAILTEAVNAASEDPPTVREFAGKLQRESTRLGDLVAQIIDLSRLQSSGSPQHGIVSIDDVVADAVDRSRVRADSREVSLVVAGEESTRVLGDHGQLVDALTNLVDNAISYSDRNARVAVIVVTEELDGLPVVNLSVADNGIGISQGEHERIFERFYRVDQGRSRDQGGTGLGLSIVRQVVDIHGGTVSVWSVPRRGSTFTVQLPQYVGGVPGSMEEGS